MRVVVDTNVLISAALKEISLPRDVVIEIAANDSLLKSAETERELLSVIARPRISRQINPAARAWLHRTIDAAEPIAIVQHVAACRDPGDDKFLELAVNGRADVIVTGDADLLALHPFHGILIETPAAFLRRVRRG